MHLGFFHALKAMGNNRNLEQGNNEMSNIKSVATFRHLMDDVRENGTTHSLMDFSNHMNEHLAEFWQDRPRMKRLQRDVVIAVMESIASGKNKDDAAVLCRMALLVNERFFCG